MYKRYAQIKNKTKNLKYNKMKTKSYMSIATIYAIAMTAILVLVSVLGNAQTNLLGNEKINVAFGFGPNYLIKEKNWGNSSEILVDYRHKQIGMEVGIGSFRNNSTLGSINYLKTLSFLRIGPSFCIGFAGADLTTTAYAGYLDGSVEAPEDIRIKKMFYCGISEKLQFNFASLMDGGLNIDFFAKLGAEMFPKQINIHNLNKNEFALNGVIGLSFKMTPQRVKKPVKMPSL